MLVVGSSQSSAQFSAVLQWTQTSRDCSPGLQLFSRPASRSERNRNEKNRNEKRRGATESSCDNEKGQFLEELASFLSIEAGDQARTGDILVGNEAVGHCR